MWQGWSSVLGVLPTVYKIQILEQINFEWAQDRQPDSSRQKNKNNIVVVKMGPYRGHLDSPIFVYQLLIKAYVMSKLQTCFRNILYKFF
jgi:hypothetical protein